MSVLCCLHLQGLPQAGQAVGPSVGGSRGRLQGLDAGCQQGPSGDSDFILSDLLEVEGRTKKAINESKWHGEGEGGGGGKCDVVKRISLCGLEESRSSVQVCGDSENFLSIKVNIAG